MSYKKKCCSKYKRKGKSCKRCPLMGPLCKKERKRMLAACQ